MKQIILCVCLLLGVLCSCDKKPINGKLDGRWQLMTIEYNDGSIKECERIYCSIQLHLVELMDKGTTPLTLIGHFSSADGVMMGEFKYQDNMEATVTEEDLNRFVPRHLQGAQGLQGGRRRGVCRRASGGCRRGV